MPSSAAFPNPKKTIVYASDKISETRDKTIYKELAENVKQTNNIAVQKKNNVMYQDNFFQKSCNNETKKLAAAKNYDLLLSIIKGKRYINPTLEDGSARSVDTAQNGNHLYVTYDNNQKIPVSSTSKDSCDYLKINTPNRVDLSGSYVIDPSNQIFYSSCYTNSSPWKQKDIVDVSFQDLNSYWRSANAQPLIGMNFTSNITFKQQNPQPFSAAYPYPPKTSSGTNTGAELNKEWCDGKNNII